MQPKGEVNPLDLGGHPNPLPPFTPAGEATYLANAKFIAAGAVLDCDPFGVSRNFFTPRPFEILLTRDRLVQHFEYYDNWREIWTDGRKISDGCRIPSTWDIPSAVGMETRSSSTRPLYNGKAFLTWQGFPISESMHQTERWQRVDPETLKIRLHLRRSGKLCEALVDHVFLEIEEGLGDGRAPLHAVRDQGIR